MKNFIFHKNNFKLILFYFILSFFSVLSILLAELNNNKTPLLFLKQIIYYIISFFIIYYMQKISIYTYEKYSVIFFIISLILLFLILITPESLAPTINGAKSWFNFKIFSLQPSEFAKASTVMLISYFITKNHFINSSDIFKLFQIGIIISIPFILIVKENDFGNAIYFVFLFLILAFLISSKNKTFLFLYSVVFGFISFILISLLYFPKVLNLIALKTYQSKRLLAWYNPKDYIYDYSYQITNALNEVKKGNLTGSFSKNTTYISEQFNDFIITVIAKNFGFIGVCLFILLFLLFILKIIKLSKECEKGNFSFFFILLTVFNFSFSFIINSYSATGLIPVIGVSMAFVSYGGSSLLANSILFGIILKINSTIYEERLEDYNYDLEM